MPDQTDAYKIQAVEYPQEGITIHYGSRADEPRFDRGISEAFDMLGIIAAILPLLYIIHVILRYKAERSTVNAIIRQGKIEADRQSELRCVRREENQT